MSTTNLDTIQFAYGRKGLSLRLPDAANAVVLRTQPCPGLPDPEGALRKAVSQPIDSRPLAEIATGRQSACVVICDITRPVPNAVLLPPILSTLEDAGIPRDAITILIATGIHRPNEGSELIELVGEEIAANYRCVNHLSKDDSELLDIGKTDAGIPLYINRHYVESDLKVLTGFIEPHLWAGYSGGRKLILPGIAGLKTMRHMHSFEMIDHPGTCYGNLEDNPFHEAGLEVAGKVGVDFIVNITLNEKREITACFAGDYRAAHARGVAFCEKISVCEVDGPVDLAITCGGGAPLDRSLYQTVKGISGANPIVRDGGLILVASECKEKAGSPEFTELLDEADSVEGLLEKLQQPDFFMVDQWIAQELYQVRRQKRIALYSAGLSAEEMRGYFLEPIEDFQAAVDEFVRDNPSARIAVIPEGPYVITRLKG